MVTLKTLHLGDIKCYCSRILPPKSYISMVLFGVIFYRGTQEKFLKYLDTYKGKVCTNHEFIHIVQIRDLGWLKFLTLYVYCYLVLKFKYKMNHKDAYHNIPFEREAKLNQTNFDYCQTYWECYDDKRILVKS